MPERCYTARVDIPRVGVGAVILDGEGRVLLALRRRAPEAGCWSIPGGKVDFMERLEDAAVREVYEELGVRVRIERLLCLTDHLLPEEGQHWVAPAYLARIEGGEPVNREPEALGDVRWFEAGALPENLTITTRKALEALRAGGAERSA